MRATPGRNGFELTISDDGCDDDGGATEAASRAVGICAQLAIETVGPQATANALLGAWITVICQFWSADDARAAVAKVPAVLEIMLSHNAGHSVTEQ